MGWNFMKRLAIEDIERAREKIAGSIRPTPVAFSKSLSDIAGVPVSMKLEQHQSTGSFKLRGATNAISNLTRKQAERGVVGVSTGNHGRGLARAARKAGINCTICMSGLVPENKVAGIRDEGADIRISGQSQDEAQIEADRLVHEHGMTMLPPFDHPHVIAGQGTLGLEILEEVEGVGEVIVPLSGGGLISGVALAVRSRNPNIRVIGVTMERGAAMHESLQTGKPVEVEEVPTLADALGGGIGLDNQYTFEMVRTLVSDTVLVNETDIAEAIRHAYWEEKQILEGSGSVAIAAIRSGKYKPQGNTVLVLSGGNIDMALHQRIISGENVDVSGDEDRA